MKIALIILGVALILAIAIIVRMLHDIDLLTRNSELTRNRFRDYKSACCSTDRKLQCVRYGENGVAVEAVYDLGTAPVSFVIKTFNDPDADFNMREARELIAHLSE